MKVLKTEINDDEADMSRMIPKLPLFELLIALGFPEEFALTSYEPKADVIASSTTYIVFVRSWFLQDCGVGKVLENNDRTYKSRLSSSQVEENDVEQPTDGIEFNFQGAPLIDEEESIYIEIIVGIMRTEAEDSNIRPSHEKKKENTS